MCISIMENDLTEDKQKHLKIIKRIKQDINIYKNIDVDHGYLKTVHKIKSRSRQHAFSRIFTRAASILLIPLLLSTIILLTVVSKEKTKNAQTLLYTEITAAPGTIIQTELPDRSVVWLNSGSSLRYPSRFSGDKRKVELSGEAFFNVQTNPDIPFEVTIPSGLQILAYGTAFNINAYQEDQTNEIVLQEGIVDIKYKQQNMAMKPNDMICFYKNDHSIKRSVVNIEEKIAWKNGRIIFRNAPLEEVMKRLSRRYNVDITLHKEQNIDYRIRASFSNETITQILDFLKMAAPIEWELSETEQNTDDTFTKQHIYVSVK